MIRVFGSRELVEDQMCFLMNAGGFDGDNSAINSRLAREDAKSVPEELWKMVDKNYLYSAPGESMTSLINAECYYEENNTIDWEYEDH